MRKLMACLVALVATSAANAVPIVYTTDFIPNGTRTGFNGFEAIPNNGIFFTGGAGPYAEGGISVTQVNGNAGNDIWATFFSPEGNFGWYPNGGDNGYTRITMTDGSDFGNVGFLLATGYGSSVAGYELWNNGVLILSGTLPGLTNGSTSLGQYLGFGGGGFDEIRLRDIFTGGGSPLPVNGGASGLNALAIDAIEISAVPEPISLVVFGGLIVGGGLVARKRLLAKKAVA